MYTTRTVPTLLLACVLSAGAPARAQTTAKADANADASFAEGRRLVSEGRYAEACPTFARADALRAGVGTKLNLADCFEHLGKSASAWRMFLVAATAADAAKDERATFARARAAAIEPRLVRVTIASAPDADVDGLEVTIDGAARPRARWGDPQPVDPGTIHVVARAPGRKGWSAAVDATGDGRTIHVLVPRLDPQVPPDRAALSHTEDAHAAPPPARGLGAQRTWALFAAGAGLASLGVGAAFGLTSKSRHDASDARCQLGPRANECDADGVRLADEAITAGNFSTLFFALGAAGLGTAGVLWLTAPARATGLSVAPTTARNGGGLVLRGAW